jgi:poly-beta-hydroxybutyrate-responsive repressor
VIDVDADGGRSDGENVLRTWLPYDEGGEADGTAALSSEWLLSFLLLSIRGRDLHGNELLQKIGDLGFGAVRSGEVYMILWKAEGEGLIFSEPGDAEHVLSRWRYGLTEVGEAYLEFLANSLESYSKEIEVFFRAYDGRALHEVRG